LQKTLEDGKTTYVHGLTELIFLEALTSLSLNPICGQWEMPEKKTDKTCMKLGPGRLGGLMETHQPPPPPVSLLYTVATQGGEAFFLGRECDIIILRNRGNL
jgi:hypothetical protein